MCRVIGIKSPVRGIILRADAPPPPGNVYVFVKSGLDSVEPVIVTERIPHFFVEAIFRRRNCAGTMTRSGWSRVEGRVF
jgi:hypothetical protein